MARTEVFRDGRNLQLTATHPTTPTSGGPVRYGELVGVAVNAEDATSGRTTVTLAGVHLLSVKGIDGVGNSAVAAGDKLYYTDADTPPISKKATGRFVGYAVEAQIGGTSYAGTVTSGSTATIPVLLARA